MMLTCSASHVLPLLHEQLPLPMLCGGELGCLARGRKVDEFSLNAGPRVWMVEWEVLTDVAPALETGCHVIALDPPFRSLHIDRLTAIAADGVALHLYYAAEERQETARLLRYLVHPRFAMVCLFRAMQEPALGESATKDEAINRAARMAWREGQVVLTMSDLLRAAAILEELGCGHDNRREAKLDVRSSPTYIAAEAEYEECVRLCLTL